MTSSSIKFKLFLIVIISAVAFLITLTIIVPAKTKNLAAQVQNSNVIFEVNLLASNIVLGMQTIAFDNGEALGNTLELLKATDKSKIINKVDIFNQDNKWIMGLNSESGTLTEKVSKLIISDKKTVQEITMPLTDSVGSVVGYLKVVVSKKHYLSQISTFTGFLFIMTFFVTLILVIVCFTISKSILHQVGGEPSAISDYLEKVAQGDLTRNTTVDYEKVTGIYASTIKMTDSFNEALSQVISSVDQVSTGSNQVLMVSQSLSEGASEQASAIEQISTSIDLINNQSKQNALNAEQANTLSKQSREDAALGNNRMNDLIEAMSEINKSSNNVMKVVQVIDEFSFQTNILALNATIEAAKAGVYGKSFAVVATEVKNLAGRSAQAVKETTEMVENSLKTISNANILAEAAAKQLNDIVKSSSKVVELVEEIFISSREQAEKLHQIDLGVQQIDNVTQQNSTSAEECASTSETLAAQSEELKTLISRFKLT